MFHVPLCGCQLSTEEKRRDSMHDKLKIASDGSAIFSKSGISGYMWLWKLAWASKGEADKARNGCKRGEDSSVRERWWRVSKEGKAIKLQSKVRQGRGIRWRQWMEGGRGLRVGKKDGMVGQIGGKNSDEGDREGIWRGVEKSGGVRVENKEHKNNGSAGQAQEWK